MNCFVENDVAMSNYINPEEWYRIQKELGEIAGKVINDPCVRKKAEEYQKKYGTLTPDDLKKRFTI